MSSLWFDPKSLLLNKDVGFCPAHAAPTCRVNRDATLASTAGEIGEITLCFGKPICASCYYDYFCKSPCSVEKHNKTWSSRNSCECRQSFFCDNCYQEAKSQDSSFCRFCSSLLADHVKYYCSECEGTDGDAESLSDEDDDASLSDEDIYDFYVNTVDWTCIVAFEELGIDPTSRLGRLMVGFLLGKVVPVKLFKILDTVLGDDPALLRLLTSVPDSDGMEDVESVKSGDEGGDLEDWMVVNPGVLGQLVSELDVTE